ncbi:hypothetical protein BY996DRAFT_6413449 [Phakopsora pachyrhizi]|uniref:Expressed protein n=1 Tax=Phakopsora pachyrhizi TaxID=170000 RepID=A0AAV0AKI2_PHAPC|nr:hypothetical protein BY996DRAFT_6413449 [Phakopsora pachyrhizi]CAH7668141.1 expressed protein [Phakopsora pachyrhizi]
MPKSPDLSSQINFQRLTTTFSPLRIASADTPPKTKKATTPGRETTREERKIARRRNGGIDALPNYEGKRLKLTLPSAFENSNTLTNRDSRVPNSDPVYAGVPSDSTKIRGSHIKQTSISRKDTTVKSPQASKKGAFLQSPYKQRDRPPKEIQSNISGNRNIKPKEKGIFFGKHSRLVNVKGSIHSEQNNAVLTHSSYNLKTKAVCINTAKNSLRKGKEISRSKSSSSSEFSSQGSPLVASIPTNSSISTSKGLIDEVLCDSDSESNSSALLCYKSKSKKSKSSIASLSRSNSKSTKTAVKDGSKKSNEGLSSTTVDPSLNSQGSSNGPKAPYIRANLIEHCLKSAGENESDIHLIKTPHLPDSSRILAKTSCQKSLSTPKTPSALRRDPPQVDDFRTLALKVFTPKVHNLPSPQTSNENTKNLECEQLYIVADRFADDHSESGDHAVEGLKPEDEKLIVKIQNQLNPPDIIWISIRKLVQDEIARVSKAEALNISSSVKKNTIEHLEEFQDLFRNEMLEYAEELIKYGLMKLRLQRLREREKEMRKQNGDEKTESCIGKLAERGKEDFEGGDHAEVSESQNALIKNKNRKNVQLKRVNNKKDKCENKAKNIKSAV